MIFWNKAYRPAPDFEVRKKRKLKKKAVAESEEPRKKKKKLIIRNKGISISETCISDSIAIDLTVSHPHTTTENILSEPSSDQHMVDAPEQNESVPENEISEQTISVSENIIPETIPSETIPSDQPNTIPSEQALSEQQQQTQSHTENIIYEHPENSISEPTSENRQSSPLPSPVFDDFSKTDFFSEIPSDRPPTPQNNDPSTENNSQIVPVVAENITPLKTVIDLTVTSNTEPLSPQHSSYTSSSGSSFHIEDSMANLIPRRRPSFPKLTPQPFTHSETRVSVPSSFFVSCSEPFSPTLSVTQKKPIVGQLLWNFECEMKKWIAFLNESCSESQDPIEAQNVFSQFRKKFNSAASTIQDICCKNALDNLFKRIKTRVLYLKNEPKYESYTTFAERCATAKAAEKAFLLC